MSKRNRERVTRIKSGLEAPRVLSAEERRKRKELREAAREIEKQAIWGMRKPVK